MLLHSYNRMHAYAHAAAHPPDDPNHPSPPAERDNGWIHTLLEEAENERMHLLTFMKLRQPGIVFRAAVLAGQGERLAGRRCTCQPPL